MSIPEFSKSDLELLAENEEFPCLIMFFASWCETCSIQEATLDAIRKKWGSHVIMGKVDMDRNPLTAAKNMILSIPTLVLFKGGSTAGRIEGYAGEEKIESFLDRQLSRVVEA